MRARMDATRLSRLVGICVLVALAIQLFRPARTNPPSTPAQAIAAHVTIPQPVDATVRRACYDCHSNQTRWPWYSGVAPISWFVIGHVNDGRRALNFDDWTAHGSRRTAPPLGDVCKEVSSGAMPLSSYLLLHHDARLSPADIQLLCTWANSLAK